MECVEILKTIKQCFDRDNLIQKRRDLTNKKLSDFWKIQYNRVFDYCSLNNHELGNHQRMD